MEETPGNNDPEEVLNKPADPSKSDSNIGSHQQNQGLRDLQGDYIGESYDWQGDSEGSLYLFGPAQKGETISSPQENPTPDGRAESTKPSQESKTNSSPENEPTPNARAESTKPSQESETNSSPQNDPTPDARAELTKPSQEASEPKKLGRYYLGESYDWQGNSEGPLYLFGPKSLSQDENVDPNDRTNLTEPKQEAGRRNPSDGPFDDYLERGRSPSYVFDEEPLLKFKPHKKKKVKKGKDKYGDLHKEFTPNQTVPFQSKRDDKSIKEDLAKIDETLRREIQEGKKLNDAAKSSWLGVVPIIGGLISLLYEDINGDTVSEHLMDEAEDKATEGIPIYGWIKGTTSIHNDTRAAGKKAKQIFELKKRKYNLLRQINSPDAWINIGDGYSYGPDGGLYRNGKRVPNTSKIRKVR
jgi:hypothetical protein